LPNLSDEIVYDVAQQKIPYRMDLVREDVLIDTSHNGQSFDNLMKSLDRMEWQNIVFYVTILEGKELDDIVEVLKKYKHLFAKIICFDFESDTQKMSNGLGLYNLLKDEITSEYVANMTEIILEKTSKKVFAGSFYSIPLIMDLINHQN
jgi:folylpolyglutamate synthase/dihydropteroate synthase